VRSFSYNLKWDECRDRTDRNEWPAYVFVRDNGAGFDIIMEGMTGIGLPGGLRSRIMRSKLILISSEVKK
jgi:signal transduction histidine kinase